MYFTCITKCCKENSGIFKYFTYFLFFRYYIYTCFFAWWYVHICTKVTDISYCILNDFYFILFCLEVKCFLEYRPVRYHNGLFFIL